MESATQVAEKENTLVSAEAMREMTISKEVLFEQQKNQVLDTFMSSMVRIASEQGNNLYNANLNPQFDPTMLGSITTQLTDLGYVVEVETKTQEKLGSYISMTIKW